MYQRVDVREGMTVRSIDGEKLGRVFAVQEGEFLIEKGLFFPKDYVCRYAEISDIRDGEIILLHGKEGLHRFSFDADRGVLAGTGGGAGVGPGAVGIRSERSTERSWSADTPAVPPHAAIPIPERPSWSADTAGVPPRDSVPFTERPLAMIPEAPQRPSLRAAVLEDRSGFEEEQGPERMRREDARLGGDEDAQGPRRLDLTPDDPTLRRR